MAMNRDKGINAQDAYRPYSPVVNKGENNPKARAQATSLSSSFKKGINCFNCSYEGHYTHECRKPKQQDGGNTPKARLNALEVHESDLDDIRESDGDHPNTDEQTESPQDPVGDEPELMDLMNLYSMIDEEGEDDELVGYLGAMHPIEETISELDDEIVYCRAMDATCGDLPQLLSADSRRARLPENTISDHNDQGWTWRELYGAIHQAECEDCTRYLTHLKEALGNEILSAIAAVNYPSAMARREFDRGWDAYERTEVYSNWVVAQKGLGSDDSKPHYDMVYCKSMRETVDREVNPEEEAHLLDPRGNYLNGACSPQGYWFSEPDEDYGPSFLYNGLAAEAAASRAPQVKIDDEWG